MSPIYLENTSNDPCSARMIRKGRKKIITNYANDQHLSKLRASELKFHWTSPTQQHVLDESVQRGFPTGWYSAALVCNMHCSTTWEGFWERCLLSGFQCFWYLNVLTSHCVDLQWYPSHVTSSREGAFNQWLSISTVFVICSFHWNPGISKSEVFEISGIHRGNKHITFTPVIKVMSFKWKTSKQLYMYKAVDLKRSWGIHNLWD